jgi:hypothetical protein
MPLRREVDDRHYLRTVEQHIVRADVAVHELARQRAKGSLMLGQPGDGGVSGPSG